MDGALRRDGHQARVLLRRQLPGHLHLELNSVEHSFFRLAIGAVLRVDARMAERHGDVLERKLFLARIQPNRHRGANAQRGQ